VRFNVTSGEHNLSLEAMNFICAAEKFISAILALDPKARLGDAISVEAGLDESFFLTANIVKKIEANRSMMKIYHAA